MTAPEMTNQEMRESLASLLQWRDKAERRLAEAERLLKEAINERERKIEMAVPPDFVPKDFSR